MDPHKVKKVETVVILISAMALIAVIVVGIFVLSLKGVDTTGFVSITAPVLAVLLGLLAIGRQNSDIKAKTAINGETLDRVEKQTNGRLDALFGEVLDRLDKIEGNQSNG